MTTLAIAVDSSSLPPEPKNYATAITAAGPLSLPPRLVSSKLNYATACKNAITAVDSPL